MLRRKTEDDQPIDCIRLKRQIQAAIRQETRGMTHEEELRYIRRQVAKSPFPDFVKKRFAPASEKALAAKT